MKHIIGGYVLLVTLVIISGCHYVSRSAKATLGEAPIAHEVQISNQPESYVHPMMGAVIDGKVMLYGTKGPSPNKVYVVTDEITSSAERAAPVKFCGVRVLDTSKDTPAERREIIAAGKTPAPPPYVAPVIAKDLSDWAATAGKDDERKIFIALARPSDYVPPYYKFEQAVAHGLVKTNRESDTVRARIAAGHSLLVRREQESLELSLKQIGVKVVSRCKATFCMTLQVKPEHLHPVAGLPRVVRMDAIHPLQQNAIRGREIIAGSQLKQFVDNNYDGSYAISMGESLRVRAGVIEDLPFNVNHVAFNDSNSGGSRIALMRFCDQDNNPPCSSVSNFGPPCNPGGGLSRSNCDHSTMVAGLLAGDLVDGQDSNFASSSDRVDRSGYGREASIYMWYVPDDSDILDGLSDVANYSIPVLNMSITDNDGDKKCWGKDTLSREVNDLFEAGTVVFSAAGNDGHDSKLDCRVRAPGSALGSFVVGAHGNNNTGNVDDVRTADIKVSSSRGGIPDSVSVDYEGLRTIIDITAHGWRHLMPDRTGGYNSNQGTSFAAPTVAGAAVDFIDWHKTNHSSSIDDPLRLTANMLLMGDRQGQSGSKLWSGYDNLWGAGRLKMRKFDDDGLDAQYQWTCGTTCVNNHEYVYINLNDGNKIPDDVDVLKAVVFWFDRNGHESGDMDDVDLYLQRSHNGSDWTTVRSSWSSVDEKERVFTYNSTGDYFYRIRLHGWEVKSDNTGCGTDSIRVAYAWFFEDSDRETWENLIDIDKE